MRSAVAMLCLSTLCGLARPAAAADADTYMDLGVLSLVLATFGGALGVPACALSLHGEAKVAGEWTVGGVSIALAVAAVPLLVVGAMRYRAVAANSVPFRAALSARQTVLVWTF